MKRTGREAMKLKMELEIGDRKWRTRGKGMCWALLINQGLDFDDSESSVCRILGNRSEKWAGRIWKSHRQSVWADFEGGRNSRRASWQSCTGHAHNSQIIDGLCIQIARIFDQREDTWEQETTVVWLSQGSLVCSARSSQFTCDLP